jgi:hypothetical protein
MSTLQPDKVPEEMRSPAAHIEERPEETKPYDWLLRTILFVVVTGVVTAVFGFLFIIYGIGMSMSAGGGSSNERMLGWLIIFGYPVVVGVAAILIFKPRRKSGARR